MLNSSTQDITVTVTNVNDNSPVFTSGAAFSVAENQTSVGTVLANDADGDSLTYFLSGADASAFSINSSTGVITFNSAPDYETKTSYSVTVTASGTNAETQSLTISITNVNEYSPVINSSSTFTVEENQTAVGTVSASDNDTSESLTYSLSGTDASSFSINSSSGVINFNSAPDYETKTSYSMTLNVSDGDNIVTQSLTVNITNLNDNSPQFSTWSCNSPVTCSGAYIYVPENQTTVGTIIATDADGDDITYSISGSDVSSSTLSINASTGVVT